MDTTEQQVWPVVPKTASNPSDVVVMLEPFETIIGPASISDVGAATDVDRRTLTIALARSIVELTNDMNGNEPVPVTVALSTIETSP
jgi:hypothetical protein